MRVAVLANRFPEISETFVIDQFIALLRHGFDAHVYAGRPREGNAAVLPDVNGDLQKRVHWFPQLETARSLRLPAAVWKSICAGQGKLALEVLRRRNFERPRWAALLQALPLATTASPDVVHAQFGPNGLFALELRRMGVLGPAVPIVVTFHGYDVHRSPLRYGPDMYRELFAAASALTCGSRFMADALLKLGAPAEKLHVIPMGVDTNLFAPASSSKTTSNRPLRVLTVSRLAVEKGLSYAVEAAALLREQGLPVEWTFIGDGPLRNDLTRLAQERGVAEQLSFPGARVHAEIPPLMQRSDVLVLPSIHSPDGNIEGQGLVLAEAQACGLPVIATRIGGIPESIKEGETGFLAPEKDPEAIAEAIRRLYADPALRNTMGSNARHWAIEEFDSSRLHKRLAELLRQVATPESFTA